MKKVFMILLLTAMTIGAFAQSLTLTNHSTCPIRMEIFAEDLSSGYGPCVLQSRQFVLSPGASVVYSDVSAIAITPGPGWLNPFAFPTAAGRWNAIKFYYLPSDCGSWVGDVISCGAPQSWSGFCCQPASGSVLNTATWTFTGSNVAVDWY